jgi:DNA uptake protein and related DNA-binding proteins
MKRQRREILGIVALAAGIVLLRVLWVPRPLVLPPPEEQLVSAAGVDFGRSAREGPAKERDGSNPQPSDRSGGKAASTSGSGRVASSSGSGGAPLQTFDPNTLDSVGFVRLGFSSAQARTLLKYRSAGGRFRRAEDFAKSYVVSPEMYEKLAPFIRIETDIHGREIHKDAVSQGAAKNSSSLSTEGAVQASGKRTTSPPGSASPSSSLASPPRVEINSAGEEALQKLRGIGPYYAQKIIQYRERLGGFVLIGQLLEIEGIDEERLAQFGEQVDIDYEKIRPLSLTDADAKALGAHPYIGPYAARWIVHYRTQFGDSVCRPQVLLRRGIIKEKQAALLEYYVGTL